MSPSVYRPPWRIDIETRPGVRSPVAATSLADLVAAALAAVDAPAPASIGVILSGDAELAGLNAEHMGKDGPTDVLSFPLLAPEAFAPGAPAELRDPPRPPRSRLHLGDLVVSVERAAEQASSGRGGQTGDVRWPVADELQLLVVHGALHLVGYDHETDDGEMLALQDDLMAKLS